MKQTWRVSELASHLTAGWTKLSGCSADVGADEPPFHCDRHQQFEAARTRQFEKMSLPETHKITSSSTGRDKGSEDFMLVTF